MCEAINENKRAELISTLVENLPVFRAKLGVTQDTFAQRVGLTKTTLNHIENHKKELTWSNFITIILLLMQNEDTKPLVEVMGLYPEDLKIIHSSAIGSSSKSGVYTNSLFVTCQPDFSILSASLLLETMPT